MITDEDGNVVKEKKYEAFGNIVWEEGTHDDKREFTSKEKDPTGFHYFGARYYYGNVGRFLSPDPHTVNPGNISLANPQELNPYVYCVNNPLKYKDPNGEFMITVEYSRSAQYGSKALVWNGLLPDGVFDVKTRADISGTNAAIIAGFHSYEVGYHTGNFYPQHKALIFNENKAIRTEEPNPHQGEKEIATGIHGHAGNPMTENNVGKAGSAGCFVVPTVKEPRSADYNPKDPTTYEYYNKFMSSFKEGDKGWNLNLRLESNYSKEDVERLFNSYRTYVP